MFIGIFMFLILIAMGGLIAFWEIGSDRRSVRSG